MSSGAHGWPRSARGVRSESASSAAEASPAPDQRRIALGVFQPGYPNQPDALERYIALAGRAPAIVHYFQRWTRDPHFNPAAANRIAELGAVPLLSWEPWQGIEPIVLGHWDDYIRQYARDVTAYGEPLFLRFAHEMNLAQIPWFGPPDTFRAAWRRIHDLFDDAGAGNVRWVWSPYVNGANAADLRPYFPGNALVDWQALDGYNWAGGRSLSRWQSFQSLFASSLAELRELMPGGPVMLAEIGCAPGRRKARWMRDALLRDIPERHPEVRAVVWFNEDRPEHADWRIDSSADALAAWQEAVADPRYALIGSDLVSVATG